MSILSVGSDRRQHSATSPAPVRRPVEAPRPPLRLVEPPARRRRIRVGLVSTVCLGAVFVGLFALAAMHSLVVQAQFELDRVDQQVADRSDRIDERRVQVAELESPAAIVDAAHELGLVPPTDTIYLTPESVPSEDDSAPVAGEPTGVQAAGGDSAAP